MREELNSSIGLYFPSFLKMHIDVEEELDDIFKLSPEISAAFIHEYVHFLQDIATVYGQKNIISVVEYIKSVNINHRKSTESALHIPYIPEEKRDMGVYYNAELQKLHIGNVKKTEAANITSVKTETVPIFIGYETVEVQVIKLIVTSREFSEQIEYSFGSHAIIESMAFSIEQMLYPNVIQAPKDFCYQAAAELMQFCYPELFYQPLNLIALCDASLMYYNPAAIFYSMLLKMKEEDYIPNTPYDIYDFVHSNIEVEFWGLTKINEIFNNHTLTALSSLQDYFTSELFAPNKEWIDYTLRKANEFRSSNWGFFIGLASNGPIEKNVIFKQLFAALGMPMLTNKTGAAFFASPVYNQQFVRPDILWAINQIYNIYINTAKSQIRRCAMQHWCENSCKQTNVPDYTDYRCIESPWERVNDETQLCVFAQIWKTWGLENKIPSMSKDK